MRRATTQPLADSSSWPPGNLSSHTFTFNTILSNDRLLRFAGEGLDEVTGESLSSHPNSLCRSIINLEHRLYRFSLNLNLNKYVELSSSVCLHSFFYGAQKQYFSPHDMMATQLRCSRHSKR